MRRYTSRRKNRRSRMTRRQRGGSSIVRNTANIFELAEGWMVIKNGNSTIGWLNNDGIFSLYKPLKYSGVLNWFKFFKDGKEYYQYLDENKEFTQGTF